MKKGFLFVISGPSGVGKTTLLREILKDRLLKDKLVKSISFTTRPKRVNEKDKKDYFFISKEEFKNKLKDKKILEWTRYLGYDYATPKDFVEEQLRQGRSVILCLDFKGASRIKSLYPQDSVTIFLKPPSLKVLEQRILKRSRGISGEELSRRLKIAKEELSHYKKYDYWILNKNLKQAIEQLKRIILAKVSLLKEV
ncbi:MAG: guanylate kinase [Candidatus Omnitrophica bacterium]|nr:guanylate kinase [Candidatus Omnitrophota bacterium]